MLGKDFELDIPALYGPMADIFEFNVTSGKKLFALLNLCWNGCEMDHHRIRTD